MNAHRAMIEAGPQAIRRLCCGSETVADIEVCAAALAAIDDPVALVGDRPVQVWSLWSTTLRRLAEGHRAGMIVVHPSWWSAARVAVVTRAARAAGDEADDIDVDRAAQVWLRPRSWLLRRATTEATVVVEIADRLVAVVGEHRTAVPRRAEPERTAEEVAAAVDAMTPGIRTAVVIDAPGAVAGASELGASICAALVGGQRISQVNDPRLIGLARSATTEPVLGSAPAPPHRSITRLAGPAVAGIGATVVAVLMVAGLARPDRRAVSAVAATPTTVLVEGHVAVAIPTGWPTQRVIGGPGSTRVQITSPADPEVALHVTQSPVPGETLAGTAERLKRAIDAEPAGVFVDFDPSGVSAGRPAVTYREVRTGHDVRWTVVLDTAVRISIGCQSRTGAAEVIREVCERAVRSAHAVH
ncbi:type VII secretion-associated protein [Mycobacterium marinum]|uniref:type VII secretion-associated protein n=1 Tax=Mycobacterium marinum TaxID=1781 RepID=UPI0019225124|nr:type VII secretion-associated protein [Mycobacterium marinum]QQW34445.1 type VII secretion-associated protein [Mycobacterium marinum]